MSNNLGIKLTSLFLMSVVIEMYVEFPKFQFLNFCSMASALAWDQSSQMGKKAKNGVK